MFTWKGNPETGVPVSIFPVIINCCFLKAHKPAKNKGIAKKQHCAVNYKLILIQFFQHEF